MATLKTDELNNLKSIPYEQYFGEMNINYEEKDKRIQLAKEFEEVFLFIVDMILIGEFDFLTIEKISKDKFIAISLAYLSLTKPTAYIIYYSNYIIRKIIESTINNIQDEYYTSFDRVMVLSEEQANTIGNYQMQIDAIKKGYTKKQWITMRDNKVRHSHAEINGHQVGIFDAFKVGDSELLYPRDYSLGASDKEIINCRCTIIYMK